MTWTLLTNDDGVDSPALMPFARALGAGAGATDDDAVRVVVPDTERSWIGKAITRFEPVRTSRVARDGIEVTTCSGTPSDGVQLAVHTLFEAPPALVVSGINLGFNHGAGFLLSSGTVGAAMEGWIAGVPAVAFSTGTMTDYGAWRRHARSPEAADDWRRLASLCTGLLADIRTSGLLGIADVVTVNVPFDATAATPRRVTDLARVGYDRLFRPDGTGGYVHDFGGAFTRFAPLEGTDVDAGQHGWISVTPLRMPGSPPVGDAMRRALQDPDDADGA